MKKTVLITGASSGIGKAFAFEYAGKGMDLVLTARSEDKLMKIKKEIEEKFTVGVKVITKDLSKENSALELYKELSQSGINIDVLINNAGFGTSGEFHTMEFSSQHSQIILNTLSVADLTYYIIKKMAEKREGTIINIASTVAFQPVPYMAVYGATKAFVLSFSEALHQEYKDYGIKITAVCTGATKTSFFDKAGPVGMGKPRKAEQVVKTAVKNSEKNKLYVVDGFGNYMVTLLARFLTRQKTVSISGNILRKALYSG